MILRDGRVEKLNFKINNKRQFLWKILRLYIMDDRAITEYKLIIKICDQKKCAEYDPFGLCYVDDCMSCPNSRIKIIREDGVVMRDDFKDNKNVNAKDKL